MTDPIATSPAPTTPRRVVRGLMGCFALLFLPTSLCMLSTGILSMFGDGSVQSLSCERATGDCLLHDNIDRPLRLETIRSVETHCEDVHVSTNTYEYQCWILATLTSGATRTFSDGTGNDASEAELRAATDQINAFLTSDAPSLHVTYTIREGTTSIVNDVLLGISSLLLGGFAAYWFWKTRRA